MTLAGSSNWQGFNLIDLDIRTSVESEKYADAWKIRPQVSFTEAMTLVEQASLEDAIETDEIRKWHATEHKLIYLLENGKELTLENLRAAPMKSPKCGGQNTYLREPEDSKLEEAINVGLEYLRRKRALDSKN